MKTPNRFTRNVALALALTLSACKQQTTTPAPGAGPVDMTAHFDQMANLPFAENRPTAETAAALKDALLFQRATQTYLWALPLINTLGMKVGSEKQFGAGYNVLPIWKKRLDAKTLVTTPNSDVIYAMSYVDTGKDGPIVFEAPPPAESAYHLERSLFGGRSCIMAGTRMEPPEG